MLHHEAAWQRKPSTSPQPVPQWFPHADLDKEQNTILIKINCLLGKNVIFQIFLLKSKEKNPTAIRQNYFYIAEST